MPDLVECRSDHQYAQRPTAVYWDGERLPVQVILAEWEEPDGKGFRVLSDNLIAFDLFYNYEHDSWEVRPT